MRYLTTVLLFFCTLTYSQIPEFDTKSIFDAIDGNGTMCFAKWDSDDLVDILYVKYGIFLEFYKNVGTKASPSYVNKGYVKTTDGEILGIEHG